MKKIIYTLLVMSFLSTAQAQVKDIDRVVAVVNDGVITYSELDGRIKEIAPALQKENKNISPAQLRQQVLNQMIEEAVLIQYAQESGLRTSNEEINQYVGRLAAERKVSVEAYYQQAAKSGISRERIRQEIGNNIAIERLKQREISSRITVTDSEVNQELGSSQGQLKNQQVRLSAILVAVPENANQTIMQNKAQVAETALAELNSGKSFASVAKKYSNLSNKNSDGDMGYQSASRLPAELNAVVSHLSVGQYTQIIQTPEGFYIFKLTDRKGSSVAQPGTKVEKRYRVEHILVKVNDLTSEAQALARIQDVQQKIQQGQDFKAVAKQYSEDGSANQGGDIGWIRSGETVPEFEQMVTQLPLNQVSQPVRTAFGYHLIRVVDSREENVGQMQQKNEIRQRIADRKAQQIYLEWVQQLVASSYIVNKLHEE